jgi:hypothetical protein
MSRRPAHITQADIARAIRAAKQEGAFAVEVKIDDKASIIIHLVEQKIEETRDPDRVIQLI